MESEVISHSEQRRKFDYKDIPSYGKSVFRTVNEAKEAWMYRYVNGSACTSRTIDEDLLKDVNIDLAHHYVIANNLSEAPQIESVEKLEKLLKERDYNDYTNDYNILYKRFIEEDGTLGANAHYNSLYDIVYDLITDYLYKEPFELNDYDTIDCEFEVEE